MNKIHPLVSQTFLEHMPGAVAVMDENSNFLIGNQEMLTWTGFTSIDELVGKTYADMRCKAADQHDEFVSLDQQALVRPVTVLGYYCYQDENWRVVLAEKYPLKDPLTGVVYHISHIRDITNLPGIQSYSQFLDLKKLDNKLSLFTKEQRGYILEDTLTDPLLSTREFECLFFLLRGKTAKETANLLNLSFRTVESYINGIKQKFQCTTRSELIEYAIMQGYMERVPRSLLSTGPR